MKMYGGVEVGGRVALGPVAMPKYRRDSVARLALVTSLTLPDVLRAFRQSIRTSRSVRSLVSIRGYLIPHSGL
jgi:hypothetical protein